MDAQLFNKNKKLSENGKFEFMIAGDCLYLKPLKPMKQFRIPKALSQFKDEIIFKISPDGKSAATRNLEII